MVNLNRNNTRIRRTSVPTDLLLNPHLSNDAKAAAAILYRELHTTEEKLSKIFSELNEWGYLDIHCEDGVSVLTLL